MSPVQSTKPSEGCDSHLIEPKPSQLSSRQCHPVNQRISPPLIRLLPTHNIKPVNPIEARLPFPGTMSRAQQQPEGFEAHCQAPRRQLH
jgi:hypothetical protein